MRAGRLAAALASFALAGCGEARRTAAPAGPAAGAPRWIDVSAERGLTGPTYCGSPAKEHLLESVGSGGAFLDLDDDGDDDILVLDAWRLGDTPAGGGPREVLSRGRFTFYRNRGDGSFFDDTDRAGLGGGGAWGLAVAAGDYDGDGDLDLYVVCFGPNLLYRNRGDGSFEEVGEAAGVADPGWGGGAAFFDADGDGDLDLYVTNYVEAAIDDVLRARRTLVYKGSVDVMVGPFGLKGGVDRFYRNRGDGSFVEASGATGLEDRAEGYGLGVVGADLDGDGDADVYVANDSNPNFLFRNEGGGSFTEMGVVSGGAFDAAGAAQAGMGIAILDYDRDRVLDLLVTNFADDASTLYRGEGKLFFSDVSSETGVARLTHKPLSWGVVPVDFDQDGLSDLVIANGHIYPQVDRLTDGTRFRQRPVLLLDRGGRFEDGSAAAGPGLAVEGSFRGLALGDLEGDGDPDLLLTRIDEPPLLLAYRGGDPRRRIVVKPEERAWPAWVGARVELTAGGTTQTQLILSGGSFASQGALRALFALGAAPRADLVRVRFPGGQVQEFRDVPGGSTLKVTVPRPR